MKGNAAVYAGSFDPVTNGHIWMIERGAAAFDRLIVAVGTNPEKHCYFSLEERLRFLREVTAGLANAKVDAFDNLFLVRYAQQVQAPHILRGLRNQSDFTFEQGMRQINGDLAPDITTFFLMPPRELAEISSSMVKGLVGPEGWQDVVGRYVPAAVLKAFEERRGNR